MHVPDEGSIIQGYSFNLHSLSKFQRELLSRNNKLNHEVPLKYVQLLAVYGWFPKHLESCDRPKCGAWKLGKSCKKS